MVVNNLVLINDHKEKLKVITVSTTKMSSRTTLNIYLTNVVGSLSCKPMMAVERQVGQSQEL